MHLQANGMRAIRIKAGNGPDHVPGVVLGWGRMGGEEGDSRIQIIRDVDIVGGSHALIFIGEDVGECLAHRDGIGICCFA